MLLPLCRRAGGPLRGWKVALQSWLESTQPAKASLEPACFSALESATLKWHLICLNCSGSARSLAFGIPFDALTHGNLITAAVSEQEEAGLEA